MGPNQVWAIDIITIPLAKGLMYLEAIIDVYSWIVGWNIFNSPVQMVDLFDPKVFRMYSQIADLKI